MKVPTLYLLFLFLASVAGQAQSEIDLLLKQYNTRSVPYITVQELEENKDHYIILDTRKKEEYDVSHIPGAIWVSETLDLQRLGKFLPSDEQSATSVKNKPIVVYCSVGIRSEDFGEDLIKEGFTDVQNVYGSIFAWKDAGYNLISANGEPTDSVHVFAKKWGKYLMTGTKVY